MQFMNTYTELCRATQQEITVTACVEAEGGFGCAVGQDSVTYDCSREDDCPLHKNGTCPLIC